MEHINITCPECNNDVEFIDLKEDEFGECVLCPHCDTDVYEEPV